MFAVGQPVLHEPAEADRPQTLVDEAVGLQDQQPHDRGDRLGQHVRREEDQPQHRPPAQRPVEQQRDADGERELDRPATAPTMIRLCCIACWKTGSSEARAGSCRARRSRSAGRSRSTCRGCSRRRDDRHQHEPDEQRRAPGRGAAPSSSRLPRRRGRRPAAASARPAGAAVAAATVPLSYSSLVRGSLGDRRRRPARRRLAGEEVRRSRR